MIHIHLYKLVHLMYTCIQENHPVQVKIKQRMFIVKYIYIYIFFYQCNIH